MMAESSSPVGEQNAEAIAAASAELAKIDAAGCSYPIRTFLGAIKDEKVRTEVFAKLLWDRDDTAGEFAALIRWYSAPRGPGKPMLDMLLKISPYSPMARTLLVKFHWDAVADKAGQWERELAPHPEFLTSLGESYMALGRWADAERCFKAALAITPDNRRCATN